MKMQLQLHILPDGALEHFGHVFDDFVQVQITRLHDLFSAEQQQLASKIGRAFSGGGYSRQAFLNLRG